MGDDKGRELQEIDVDVVFDLYCIVLHNRKPPDEASVAMAEAAANDVTRRTTQGGFGAVGPPNEHIENAQYTEAEKTYHGKAYISDPYIKYDHYWYVSGCARGAKTRA